MQTSRKIKLFELDIKLFLQRKKRLKIKYYVGLFSYIFSSFVYAKLFHVSTDRVQEQYRSKTTLENRILETKKQIDHFPNLHQTMQSVMRLEFPNGSCTASLISNAGHVLTNAHCLRDCIQMNGVLNSLVQLIQTNDYKITEYSREVLNKNITCTEYYTHTHKNTLKYQYPKIVWVGKGHSSFRDASISNFPQNVLDKIRDNKVDAVVLKFELQDGVQKAPCLKIKMDTDRIHKMNEIWTMGYPDYTSRYDGFDSDGYSAFINSGFVIPSITMDKYFQSQKLDKTFYELQKKIHDQKFIIKSSLDGYIGSSGSPILNNKGQLSALFYGVIELQKEEHVGASSLLIDIEKIKKDLVEDLGVEKYEEIFNCEH